MQFINLHLLQRTLVYLMALGMVFSCQTDTQKRGKSIRALLTAETLIGVWEAVSFKVTYNATSQTTDSMYVFEVTEENWGEKLSTKPNLTLFYPNNTYRQVFLDLNKVPYDTIRGLWKIMGDTLLLISKDATYQYETKLSYPKMEQRSILDWDGDGSEDDEYTTTQRFVKKELPSF